jgi:hypothetical protein
MPINRAAGRLIFVVAGIAAGIPLFLIGLYSNVDSILFQRKALQTDAYVLNVRTTTYNYYVEFNLSGKNFRAHPPGTGSRFEQGQAVSLLYDPADPENARLADSGRDVTLNAICFVPGLGLLIGTAIICIGCGAEITGVAKRLIVTLLTGMVLTSLLH